VQQEGKGIPHGRFWRRFFIIRVMVGALSAEVGEEGRLGKEKTK
jgi:hypothetical protein